MKTLTIITTALMTMLPGIGPDSFISNRSSTCTGLMDEPVSLAQNIVYAPAFRAAWTMLVTDIIGEQVKTVNPIPLTEKLNQKLFRPENPRGWVIEAGSVQDGIIERIKQMLMYHFQETDPSLDRLRAEKDAVICFARLVKVMTFRVPFETLEWEFHSDGTGTRVACFGISKNQDNRDLKEMQKQVSIYDYRHPDDFIVRLSTADPSQEIILAKMEPESTLEETVDKVNVRIKHSFPEEFSDIDELVIPKVNLSVERVYQELLHQFLANEGFEDFYFADARQQVDFIMDESGALAKVTGQIVKIKGPVSRIYAFNKPFLVICRDLGSDEPDLVAWIATAEVMNRIP